MPVCPSPVSNECCTNLLVALADADPLGVSQNVTFDEVGGLDDRSSCVRVSQIFTDSLGRYQLAQGNDSPPIALS
jgi:hypothetical protein